MIREIYVNRINEIALNVTQTKIDSIRKKSITKSGCRVYSNGYIGVSGTLGEATEETWNEAIKNLENKVPYKFEPCKDKKRTRDLRKSNITAEEFLKESERLLEIIREEFPNFILSNKIKSIETEVILKNDLGLEHTNLDRYFQVELIVKDKDSINVFDTAIQRNEREFDIEAILNDVRKYLAAFNNKVKLPSEKKLPVIMHFYGFGNKVNEALNGNDLYKGTSIFSDKIGEKVFSEDFTVYVDRSEENIDMPFFDAEGSTVEKDRFTLIENGKINFGYSDKKTSAEYKISNTASAISGYDEVPSLYAQGLEDRRLRVKSTDKTLAEILGDKEAIFAVFMEGGDCTNEGDFASPVQMSYLMKNGKVVGRLPEFSVHGNIYEMFGEDYLGQSSDRCYFGENAMVINMNIK